MKLDPITEYILIKDEVIKEIGPFPTGTGIAIGILAIAVQLYKHYLTTAAKACAGRPLKEKPQCMHEYKKKAQQARIDALKKHISECSKAKDSEKCKRTIKKEIEKQKKKLDKIITGGRY